MLAGTLSRYFGLRFPNAVLAVGAIARAVSTTGQEQAALP
jgi:hypothetical protein